MGIDVNLYAIGDVTDEQLAEANEYLDARCHDSIWFHEGYGNCALRRTEYVGWPSRIEFNCDHRYYGPYYERGPWPLIYACIVALRAALPGCTIYYGGDSDEAGELVTDELLAGIWQHWLGPHFNDYRIRRSSTP